jgi:hypothetical protein
VADAATPAVERSHPPRKVIRAVNPVLRAVLSSRFHAPISDQLLVLHFTGRRTGRRYSLPVGYRDVDGRMAVLTNSGWRVNFRGGADVQLTLHGRMHPARATLVEDPGQVARVYRDLIEQVGVARAQRRLGIRINVDRVPTQEELVEAAGRHGLSIVYLDLRGPT